jgi:hypothetical protein
MLIMTKTFDKNSIFMLFNLYRFGHVIGKEIDKTAFIKSLDKLSQTFEKFYQMAIMFYIRLLFHTIMHNLQPEQLHKCLKSIIDLCLQDDEIKKFIIQVRRGHSRLLI